MPLLFRGISLGRWDWQEGNIPWLPVGELPAAPLRDLNTSPQSQLSVWHIDDNKANLGLVVAGIASKRQNPDPYDYALFDEHLLTDAGIRLEITPGDSYDQGANTEWHRELFELTASKVVALVRLIYLHGELDRIQENDVNALIQKSVGAGRVEKGRLNENLRKAVYGA